MEKYASPTNALGWLLHYGIITGEMHEAGHLYAEICHQKPAGGPKGYVSLLNFHRPLKEKKSLSLQGEMPLETVWSAAHLILQSSPLYRTIEKLVQEDNMEDLPAILKSSFLQSLVRSALKDLAFCLKSYDYMC